MLDCNFLPNTDGDMKYKHVCDPWISLEILNASRAVVVGDFLVHSSGTYRCGGDTTIVC